MKTPNLWLRYWYVTLVPGIIGTLLILFGISAAEDTKVAWYATGGFITAVQTAALTYWYFGTKGDPAYWMILLEGGNVIGWREPGRFMCPRLFTWLVVIDESVKLQIQFTIGPRGKDLDGQEAVGAELGYIRFSKMLQPTRNAAGDEEFPVGDPFNLDTNKATPEVTFLVKVTRPDKIRKLSIVDPKTKKCVKTGLAVAAGQVAEETRNHLQIFVAGKSIAWLQYHIKEAGPVIKAGVIDELKTRGLDMEDTTLPVISDDGAPPEMAAGVTKINSVDLDGRAKVAEALRAAEAAPNEAAAKVTLARGDKDARLLKAEALKAEAAAPILGRVEALAGKISADDLGALLKQEATTSGLPTLPPGVRQVFITTSAPGGAPAKAPEVWVDGSMPTKDGEPKKPKK